MTTSTQGTSVRMQIVVAAPVERAFRIFTEQFDRIKPREHNLLQVPIAETVFEPRVGGRLYDRGVDGSECRWARVLAFDPPHRVVISWDITPQWQVETDPERTSEAEIRFVAESADARAWSSSIEISSATERVGRRCAAELRPTRAGRCTSRASLGEKGRHPSC